MNGNDFISIFCPSIIIVFILLSIYVLIKKYRSVDIKGRVNKKIFWGKLIIGLSFLILIIEIFVLFVYTEASQDLYNQDVMSRSDHDTLLMFEIMAILIGILYFVLLIGGYILRNKGFYEKQLIILSPPCRTMNTREKIGFIFLLLAIVFAVGIFIILWKVTYNENNLEILCGIFFVFFLIFLILGITLFLSNSYRRTYL